MRDDLLKQPSRKNGIPMVQTKHPHFPICRKNKSLERMLAVIVLAVKYFSVPSFTHAISIRMHFITCLSCLLHSPRKDTKLAHQRGFGVFLD